MRARDFALRSVSIQLPHYDGMKPDNSRQKLQVNHRKTSDTHLTLDQIRKELAYAWRRERLGERLDVSKEVFGSAEVEQFRLLDC